VWVVGGAVVAAVALTGCIQTGFSDLDRAATEADVLPEGLPEYAVADFDLDSLRLVGELDGLRLYLAEGKDVPVCLLAYPNSEEWVSTCGSEMGTIGGPGYEVQVVSDPFPSKDGWTSVGQNIRVRDR